MSSAGRDALVAMLSRLKNDLKRADLAKPDAAHSALTSKYPLSGDYVAEVRRLCERGLEDGWLVPGKGEKARSARVAPQSSWFPFAIEASLIAGEAEAHGAPKGEVALCWPMEGKPKLCGSDPGWVVHAPGSKHQPKVTGGKMFMLSFLPDGAIERGVKVTKRRTRSSSAKAASSTTTRANGTKRKTAAKKRSTAKSASTSTRRRASGAQS